MKFLCVFNCSFGFQKKTIWMFSDVFFILIFSFIFVHWFLTSFVSADCCVLGDGQLRIRRRTMYFTSVATKLMRLIVRLIILICPLNDTQYCNPLHCSALYRYKYNLLVQLITWMSALKYYYWYYWELGLQTSYKH